MIADPLPLAAPLERYQLQAAQLIGASQARPGGSLDIDDARLALAHGYSFRDWAALVEHVEAVAAPGSPIREFEVAAEAVLDGDLGTLDRMLVANPALVRARSARVTCNDPPVHRATLLHYLGANGIENYRQRTPPNAAAVAARLLTAGAEVDALMDAYGGECTTLSMVVSSSWPAEAGVQVPLAEVLVDFGAAVDGVGRGHWTSPLHTALVFGYGGVAQALAARGARVDRLPLAAGLGLVHETARMLDEAPPEDRHAALALAAQLGRQDIVRLLLDAGEDPDRYNPPGMHAHGTPLHQAALAGHLETVRLLVDRGARLDIRDTLWDGTPLGWARHGGKEEVARVLEQAAG